MSLKLATIFITGIFLAGCGDDTPSQSKKKYHIGIISGMDAFKSTITGFKDGMASAGYQEGETIHYTIGHARGDPKEIKRLAKDYVNDKVDLIFTTTNGAALAAKKATEKSKIPVVFSIVLAPIESGVVDSLTHPSGNITGVRNPLTEFIGKRLEILKRLSPQIENVLILNSPTYPTIPVAKKGLATAAKLLDIQLVDIPVSSSDDVVEFLSRSDKQNFGAILVMPDIVVQQPVSLDAIYNYARLHKLPVVANAPTQLESGALFSYHSDSYQTGLESARLAYKALKKKSLYEVPVTSSEPQFVLNQKAANRLGITVDAGLIALANRIIE